MHLIFISKSQFFHIPKIPNLKNRNLAVLYKMINIISDFLLPNNYYSLPLNRNILNNCLESITYKKYVPSMYQSMFQTLVTDIGQEPL